MVTVYSKLDLNESGQDPKEPDRSRYEGQTVDEGQDNLTEEQDCPLIVPMYDEKVIACIQNESVEEEERTGYTDQDSHPNVKRCHTLQYTMTIDDAASASEGTDNSSEDTVEVKTGCGKLMRTCKKFIKLYVGTGNMAEKVVYVFAVLSFFIIGYGAIEIPWILPYVHTTLGPILVGLLRAYFYSKLKWQYFMADFCYCCNLLFLIFIWATPGSRHFFRVLFAFSYGPLFSAMLLFRNAIVFHSLDKMTSVYIHLFPATLSYALRWYPHLTSRYWYTEFSEEPEEEFEIQWQFVWLCAIPFASYLLHIACYFIIVYGILKPSPEHYTSFSYLTGEESHGVVSSALNCAGPKYRSVVYITLNQVLALLMFLVAMLCYNFHTANVVALVSITLFLIWNGATFQMDVFAKRGLQSEPYTLS